MIESAKASGSPRIRSAIRPSESLSPIDARTAALTFVAAWFAAQVLSVIVLSIFGETGGSDTPIGVLAIVLCGAWFAYLSGMWFVSDRAGTADPVDDFGIRVLPIDLIGLGIGVLAQLVVIRIVYLPPEDVLERAYRAANEDTDTCAGANCT